MYTDPKVYEYISKQLSDPIIEWKACEMSGTKFPIYQSDLDFYAKISGILSFPSSFSSPTLCPEERQRRRLAFRNERHLYRRMCDATQTQIISIYSPESKHKIYNQNYRWSDARDPMKYGRDFDFMKPFVEQFDDLMKDVPRASLHNINCDNSDYGNYLGGAKNCYMSFSGGGENTLYCTEVSNGMEVGSCDVCDCLMCIGIEDCYGCIDTHFSQRCFFCIQCQSCFECTNCSNCIKCDFCIGCDNLSYKSYCIENKQYTKEEYLEIIAQNPELKYQNYRKPLLRNQRDNLKCENCFGNGIRFGNQVIFSSYVFLSANVKYAHRSGSKGSADFQDTDFNAKSELIFNSIGCSGYGIVCCNLVADQSSYCLYSDSCYGCNHLFGCIGLRNKSYCIFNKQYTQDEYEKIIRKLIEHMQDTGERGEFFHPSLSPFGYNETVAQEYYPEKAPSYQHPVPSTAVGAGSKLVAGSRQLGAFGYKRSSYSADPKIPDGAKTIKPQDYTQEEWKVLRDTPDITKQIIICEVSHRPFLLQKAEIEFYQKHNLPIPTKHPDIRHEERMKLRPGRTLHLRNCDKCGEEMLSVYETKDRQQGRDPSTSAILLIPSLRSGGQSEKVYCETCYKQEVFG